MWSWCIPLFYSDHREIHDSLLEVLEPAEGVGEAHVGQKLAKKPDLSVHVLHTRNHVKDLFWSHNGRAGVRDQFGLKVPCAPK